MIWIKFLTFIFQLHDIVISFLTPIPQAMASPEEKAYEIMRELDVGYVLVIFGGLTGYSSDGIFFFIYNICFIYIKFLLFFSIMFCQQSNHLRITPLPMIFSLKESSIFLIAPFYLQKVLSLTQSK